MATFSGPADPGPNPLNSLTMPAFSEPHGMIVTNPDLTAKRAKPQASLTIVEVRHATCVSRWVDVRRGVKIGESPDLAGAHVRIWPGSVAKDGEKAARSPGG